MTLHLTHRNCFSQPFTPSAIHFFLFLSTFRTFEKPHLTLDTCYCWFAPFASQPLSHSFYLQTQPQSLQQERLCSRKSLQFLRETRRNHLPTLVGRPPSLFHLSWAAHCFNQQLRQTAAASSPGTAILPNLRLSSLMGRNKWIFTGAGKRKARLFAENEIISSDPRLFLFW